MSETLKDQAARVMKLARERHMTLATVESCTAGALAQLLSDTEGASATLHGGFIVYTKDNKIAAVGVPEDLLAAHTAVSAEVAEAMAKGGLSRCPADLAISVTGVARRAVTPGACSTAYLERSTCSGSGNRARGAALDSR